MSRHETTASRAPMTLTKRVMLLCATIATVIVMIGLLLLVSNRYETVNPATEICFFRCIPGPNAPILTPGCNYRCVSPPMVVTPPPGSPAPVLPDAVLLGGWVLPMLIAFLVGLKHALTHRSWGWVAFGLLPALLLEIALLGYVLSPLSQMSFSQDVTLYLIAPCFAVVFLVPAIYLLYARSVQA